MPANVLNRWDGPAAPLRDPMLVALTAATLIHLLLLLGIGFELPQPKPPGPVAFEVMVVEQPAAIAASPLAQAVRAPVERAGETAEPLPEVASGAGMDEATPDAAPEPLPVAELPPTPDAAESRPDLHDMSEPTAAPPSAAASDEEGAPADDPSQDLLSMERADLSEILTGIGADIPLPSIPALTPAQAAKPVAATTDVFASRNAEIAALTARIDARDQGQVGRQRRKAISTNTREYRYAAYMEAWRRKVERIGNLNYPQEAKELGLFGSLILHVALRADGSLERVRVVRSSGQEVLDEAAIQIVRLAAPYAPFPDDIAAETDILDITRVWQFQRNHRLGWD